MGGRSMGQHDRGLEVIRKDFGAGDGQIRLCAELSALTTSGTSRQDGRGRASGSIRQERAQYAFYQYWLTQKTVSRKVLRTFHTLGPAR